MADVAHGFRQGMDELVHKGEARVLLRQVRRPSVAEQDTT